MAPKDYKHWFDTSAEMRQPTEGNWVNFFWTGEQAFADIANALEFGAGYGGIAYFLGWSFDIATVLRAAKSPAGSTLAEFLTYFATKGGEVRAMLWDNSQMDYKGGCPGGVDHINALPGRGSSAILDNRTALAGSHHQKVQIIIGASTVQPPQAVAYCGGMDIFPDRVGQHPLHDVHCKIRGPAADDLVKVFQDRWNDHPKKTAELKIQTARSAFGNAMSMVQICCTYPTFPWPSPVYQILRPDLWAFVVTAVREVRETGVGGAVGGALEKMGVPAFGDMLVGNYFKPYDFYDYRRGVQQVWRAIKKAISEARNYIYLEDQYLTSKWVGDALGDKLADNKDFRIVILVCDPNIKDFDVQQIWPRRRDVLARLNAVDPQRKRWTCVTRKIGEKPDDPPPPYAYVHSKTWIFDDELVITGSANADRRGYTYDSEVDVVVAGDIDLGGNVNGATTIAQDLRAQLFAKHLGGKPADYLDPTKALGRWFGSLDHTNVAPFDPAAKAGDPDKYVVKIRQKLQPIFQSLDPITTAIIEPRVLSNLDNYVWNNFEDPDPQVGVPAR
jgi:phosphatidylserine/phosphatidylglycerophosphate/cardiolipin synthase-like enzyme